MSNNFIVKPRKEKMYAIVTLRMTQELLSKYDKLAAKSDRSRNEVMCTALKYAMDHLEFIPGDEENGKNQ